ncbi:MAG: hypothetical protein IKT68_01105 [Clostridia bacterium]|nr:hypothetical protein [Clostridia bacterium]
MNKRFLPLIFLLVLALCLTACSGEDPAAPTTSQGRAVATIRDKSADQRVAPTAKREVFADIAYTHYWTFNDLHDFLENTARNTQQPFSPDNGEFMMLYEQDGVTPIADWNVRLKQNMVAIQYAADQTVLCYYTINILGAPASSVPAASSEPASRPDSQPQSQVTTSQPTQSAPSSSDSVQSTVNSQPTSSQTTPVDKPDETIKITVYGNNRNKALVNAIAAFNKTNKHVEVSLWQYENFEFFNANALEQAVENQTAPNLVLMDLTQMNIAAKRGLLLDLSYTGIDKYAAGMHPTAWNNTTTAGHRYGVPVGCVTWAIAANDEILYRSNAQVPTSFTSLQTNAATVLQWFPDTPPIEIITDTVNSKEMAEQFITMLRSYGGNFLTDDQTAAAFNTKAGLDVLNAYWELKQNSYIGESYGAEDFWLGNTAYGFVDSTEYSEVFGHHARGNYTASSLVMPGDLPAVSPLNVYSYCIPATHKKGQAEAAFEFLQYYMNSYTNSLEECKLQDWIPADAKGLKDAYYQAADWQPFVQALATAKPFPTLSFADTLYDYIADAIHSVLCGKATPQQALAKAEEKINIRLKR